MTTAERTAAALRDVADMVEKLDIDLDLEVRVSNGGKRVSIEPARDRADHDVVRPALDAIADYLGVTLEASFSRGEFWSISVTGWEFGALPSGAEARVHQRVRGRPLDLKPLPQRRRKAAS